MCSPVASPNFSPKWPWSWVDVAFLHLLDDFFVCNPAKFLLECHQPAKPSSLLMNPILASVDLVLFLASVGHITARFTKKKRKIKSTCRFQQPSLLSKMFSIAAHMCMNKMTKLTTSFSLKKKKVKMFAISSSRTLLETQMTFFIRKQFLEKLQKSKKWQTSTKERKMSTWKSR